MSRRCTMNKEEKHGKRLWVNAIENQVRGIKEMEIILASASPRRRELLAQIGLEFRVLVSDVEEVVTKTHPAEVVEELSKQKAEAVLESVVLEADAQQELLVIGADTVVAYGNPILGKPTDRANAKEMLQMLQGAMHEVYTGVTLYHRTAAGEVECKIFHEVTKVEFYPMSDAEIETYVFSGDCDDKAGAYGIQGFCARYIKGIEGDYNNVVGLPVGRLYQEAKEWLQ